MHLTLEQQAHSLHHRNYTSLIFNIINGALFCIIFRTEFPLVSLVIWYAVLLGANVIRFSISSYYNHKELSESQFLQSMIMYCVGMSLTISVWASTSIFLFPVNSIPHQLYLALTVCGILSRATPVLSVNKDVYRAFIVVMLAPLLLQLAHYSTTEMHLALVLLLLVFGMTVYKSATFLATSFQRLHDLSSELKGMVTRDSLTQVANRHAFDERMLLEWKTANRHQAPLSLLMMDVDAFKAYNDTYGHQAGDQCLRTVAKVLEKSILRGTDFVARYGGEEFAVILPATDARGAYTVAERMRHHIEVLKLAHKNSQVSEHVTMSVGVATIIPKREDDIAAFIDSADQALYRSKAKGRNCVTTALAPPVTTETPIPTAQVA